MTPLTVRHIAEKIRRPHEEVATVVDRIRGWTDIGLLKAIGDKHPGTGRHRLYDVSALVDAFVLTSLIENRFSASKAVQSGTVERAALDLGRKGIAALLRKEYKFALLVITPDKPAAAGVFVHFSSGRIAIDDDTTSATVINLKNISRRLESLPT